MNETQPIDSNSDPDEPTSSPDSIPQARNPLAILFGALGLGFAFDHLFYGHLPGISVVLFSLIYVAVFAVVAYRNRISIRFENLWPVPFFLYFAAMVAIRENEFLTVINVLAVFSGAIFLPFYLAAGALSRIGLLSGAVIPIRVGWAALSQGVELRSQLKASRDSLPGIEDGAPVSRLPRIASHWGGVLRGLLLAMPVLLIFGALLASADQIFAETLARIFSIEILDWIISAIGSSFRIALLTWLAAGALIYALLRRPVQPESTAFEDDIHGLAKMLRLAFVETITVLVLVNLLFAMFVVIQLGYLFGGVEYLSTAEDFTYSDYARSGFFELVITAVLSLVFVLIAQRLSRREAGSQTFWFNTLTSLLLAFVMVLLISAYRRMAMYEATFGYTELRLLVYIFIAWLGAFLVWMIGVILLNKSDRAVVGMLIAAMGFLTTLNVVNPDAFIVERNVDRHLAQQSQSQLPDTSASNAVKPAPASRSTRTRTTRITGDVMLDLVYLDRLSNDAVPELLRAYDRLKEDQAAANQIKSDLLRRLTRIEYNKMSGMSSWQSWHYGRARVRALIKDFAGKKSTSSHTIRAEPVNENRGPL